MDDLLNQLPQETLEVLGRTWLGRSLCDDRVPEIINRIVDSHNWGALKQFRGNCQAIGLDRVVYLIDTSEVAHYFNM